MAKPVEGPDTNTRLTLTDQDGNRVEGADLPAERCVQAGTGDEMFESIWQLDDGERRAIANGAPVLLHLWGRAHPPVSIQIGEPTTLAHPQIDRGHSERAAGAFYTLIQRRLERALEQMADVVLHDDVERVQLALENAFPGTELALRLWHEALDATLVPPGDGARNNGTPGAGRTDQ